MLNPDQRTPATIIQLARHGDLVQTLPLIRALARQYAIRLVCDSAVKEWTLLLSGIPEVACLDTRRWRERCSDRLSGIGSLVDDLSSETAGMMSGGSGKSYPLNDFPVGNLLVGGLCVDHPERWVTAPLVLVRSYIRLIGSLHHLNRIHLSDLWLALAAQSPCMEPSPVTILETGTQFAHSVLDGFKRRKTDRVWAVILGSGAKCRRLEPEDFASWWMSIPVENRPGIVLLGGVGEADLAARFLARSKGSSPGILNLVGACSPPELLGLLREMDLVIGVDTGPLHWAAVVGTKTLGIYFGEAGFHDTGPYGPGHLVLSPDCAEYPCHPARAQHCNWSCRKAYCITHNLSALLSSLARGETPGEASVILLGREGTAGDSIASPGLQLSLSILDGDGIRYKSLHGKPESHEVVFFSHLAKQVLGIKSQGGEEVMPVLSREQKRQLQNLTAAWLDRINQLSLGAVVPVEIQQEARVAAVRQISRVMNKVFHSDGEDANPAPERCFVSPEPAGSGA